MQERRRHLYIMLLLIGVFALILDSEDAVKGAKDGVDICLSVIIPSLFPLVYLSRLMINEIPLENKFFKSVEKILKLPVGSGSIWILSLLSGYPIGAQLISQKRKSGGLSDQEVNKLLMFCNNPGPAFIFGVLSSLFHNPIVPLYLWIIQIISSWSIGILFCRHQLLIHYDVASENKNKDHLRECIAAISNVCGWVVLFRTIIGVVDHFALEKLPVTIRIFIYGILDLANGCFNLNQISNDGMRFAYSAGLLAFGGICVGLQSASILKKADYKKYYLSKSLQCIVSLLLSLAIQHIAFDKGAQWHLPIYMIFILIFSGIGIYIVLKRKIDVENKKIMVYT